MENVHENHLRFKKKNYFKEKKWFLLNCNDSINKEWMKIEENKLEEFIIFNFWIFILF